VKTTPATASQFDELGQDLSCLFLSRRLIATFGCGRHRFAFSLCLMVVAVIFVAFGLTLLVAYAKKPVSATANQSPQSLSGDVPQLLSAVDVDRKTRRQLEQTAQSFVKAYRKRRDFKDCFQAFF
jgi:hypothetical protein